MRHRLFAFLGALAFALAAVTLVSVPVAGQSGAARTPAPATGGALRTSWGAPDLQGLWHENFDTPQQRDPKYGNREFKTDEEIKAEDARKAASLTRDRRKEQGTEQDVAGAYNAVFQTIRYTGKRTSLIVDPPDGRMPPATPEAQKRAAATREYLQALLQGTSGGKPGPVSPRRNEAPPSYNVDRMNRADGPEDRSLAERCLGEGLPGGGGGFSRIVQSPDSVAIYYDIGQGQGFSRVIPITDSPHLPPSFHLWRGDSRGHWEGDTLVVDVTNFNQIGFNEKLHIVERWRRVDANTLQLQTTHENPDQWTRPWTTRVELDLQDGQANRIYYEPRCHEGNYGLLGMLANTRAAELAFTEGRGPDPATQDNATGGGGE